MLFEVAYAGNRGTHLALCSQLDQFIPSYFRSGNALLQLVKNPFLRHRYGGCARSTYRSVRPLLRPFPLWNGVTATNAAWSNSNYNALQMRFEKRFSNGFSLLASYTWSKTLSDGADGLLEQQWRADHPQLVLPSMRLQHFVLRSAAPVCDQRYL